MRRDTEKRTEAGIHMRTQLLLATALLCIASIGTVPQEFPSNAILPLMIVSALLIVLYIKRKELSGTKQSAKT